MEQTTQRGRPGIITEEIRSLYEELKARGDDEKDIKRKIANLLTAKHGKQIRYQQVRAALTYYFKTR